jgi:Family of unknown function (DUF6520)
MKKIRMGLIALAAITGIGGAFAANHPAKRMGTLYYAKKNGTNSFQWVTNRPPQPTYHCNSGLQAACTITSTYDVTGAAYDSILPSGATVVNGPDSYYQ